MSKQRVFSGIQPTGLLHLGNYLGAITQFVELQHRADCFFCVVDLHALTIPRDPDELREKILEVANLYLACGIDPSESTLFIQSQVTAHAELCWLLNCVTSYGHLTRMTQFKDKSSTAEIVTAGLFDYPVLMAADILLYQADVVPVGDDQKQHLELTRDVAERFNSRYGDTFVVPEPMIRRVGGRIMGLDNPENKMSKSADSPYNWIALLDDPDTIRDKVMRAVTDSGREVRFDEEEKAGISNLLTIHSLCSGESVETLEARYEGKGYGHFKKDLAEVVVDALQPVQERYEQLTRDPAYTHDVLAEGAERARQIAAKTLAQAKQNLGLRLATPVAEPVE